MGKGQKKLWIGLIVLAFLSPLGIILPEKFKAGDAWGEWGVDTLQQLLGYVPAGLKRYADIWQALIPDYNLWGEGAAMGQQIFACIISGLLGILMTGSLFYILSKVIFRREK